VASFVAGEIVIADWRDALPKEPNKRRPAIVVDGEDLFGPAYPNIILVPLSDDADLAIPELSLVIEPSPENGCTKRCYALSHCLAATSKSRVSGTGSRISLLQLEVIRRQVATAIGFLPV
jgi:mRNA interferase MazF